MKTTKETALENLIYAMSEGDSQSVTNYLFSSLPPERLKDVLKLLIEEFENQPNLLQQFWGSKSDACPLEATEQEGQENAFKGYVLSRLVPN